MLMIVHLFAFASVKKRRLKSHWFYDSGECLLLSPPYSCSLYLFTFTRFRQGSKL